MRNIGKVLDRIYGMIPDGAYLKTKMDQFYGRIAYLAPEQIDSEVWGEFTQILTVCFGRPDELKDWELEIVRVWVDNPTITREQLAERE